MEELSICSSLHSPCIFPSTRVIIFSFNFLATDFLRIPIHHQTGIESRLVLLFCFGVCCLPTHSHPRVTEEKEKNTCVYGFEFTLIGKRRFFFSHNIGCRSKPHRKNITTLWKPSRFHLVLCHREKGSKKQNVGYIRYISLLEAPVDT